MPQETMTEITPEMRQCIQNCLDCYSLCAEAEAHCREMGGKHAESRHLQLLADCAEICRLSADFMLHGSERHGLACGTCAEICRQCAGDCRSIAEGDPLMRRCADACEKCASSCEKMARM
jgi:hypothetical protein